MIFLDNASTTQINKNVNELISKINYDYFFNPSALYKQSMEIQEKILFAQEQIANILNCEANNIIFTSGATESNNLAIKGLSTNNKDAEYIFSNGEHPSVYEVANSLKNAGKIVHFVRLTDKGIVDEDHFRSIINENTHFISIMHVSNETGAINDIKKLNQIAKKINKDIIFHVDGVQAVGKINVNINDLGVDAYSVSAHKFHGPKGVGLLYCKHLNKLKPLLLGGGQQEGYRSGTENVSGILGMNLALNLSFDNLKANNENALNLRNYVKEQISLKLKDYIFNENEINNSPYILSVSFKGLRGEVLLHMLEEKGVLIGTGSACSSKKSDNRVLSEMGRSKDFIQGSIRISFSSSSTFEEVKEATKLLIETVKELKEIVK